MPAKFPTYRIKEILQRKQAIASHEDMLRFVTATLSGSVFEEFLIELQHRLPIRIEYDVLEDSCRDLLGQVLTPALLSATAWRLVANIRRLKNCHPVPPWSGQGHYEWVPAQIIEHRLGRTRRGRLGAHFTYRVLSGLTAGLTTEQFWSTSYCRVFSYEMGFSRWARQKYPFIDARQMADLRLYFRILPGIPEVKFDELAFPTAVVEWNRTIIRRRSREKFPCPRNYPLSQYCHTCPAGRDQCPAAVRRRSYEAKRCDECGRMSWFDGGAICVDCHDQRILRGDDDG